jgi:GGDEF domain-containing protein
VGDRIRAAIGRPFRLPRGVATVTGSVGVALLHGTVELQRALLVADRASYQAKHGGGDRVELGVNAVLHGSA